MSPRGDIIKESQQLVLVQLVLVRLRWQDAAKTRSAKQAAAPSVAIASHR
jgi:hypothetical protein